MHAIVGGIMAHLSGSNVLGGVTAGGLNEIVQDAIEKNVGTDPALRQWASAIIGASAEKVLQGSSYVGAIIAVSGTKYNHLLHEDQQYLMRDILAYEEGRLTEEEFRKKLQYYIAKDLWLGDIGYPDSISQDLHDGGNIIISSQIWSDRSLKGFFENIGIDTSRGLSYALKVYGAQFDINYTYDNPELWRTIKQYHFDRDYPIRRFETGLPIRITETFQAESGIIINETVKSNSGEKPANNPDSEISRKEEGPSSPPPSKDEDFNMGFSFGKSLLTTVGDLPWSVKHELTKSGYATPASDIVFIVVMNQDLKKDHGVFLATKDAVSEYASREFGKFLFSKMGIGLSRTNLTTKAVLVFMTAQVVENTTISVLMDKISSLIDYDRFTIIK